MNTNKTEAKKKYYDIVSGPNKDALFDACKYAYNKNALLTLDFAIAVAYTMPKDNPGCAYVPATVIVIKICGIEHEDGSGDAFNLYGYCKADLDSFGGTGAGYKTYKFKAYYNTRIREGVITFTLV